MTTSRTCIKLASKLISFDDIIRRLASASVPWPSSSSFATQRWLNKRKTITKWTRIIEESIRNENGQHSFVRTQMGIITLGLARIKWKMEIHLQIFIVCFIWFVANHCRSTSKSMSLGKYSRDWDGRVYALAKFALEFICHSFCIFSVCFFIPKFIPHAFRRGNLNNKATLYTS